MKKVLAVLLAGVMFLGIGSVVMAASDTSQVQVKVNSIDVLDVTDGGMITLSQVSGNNITGPDDSTAILSYTHNSASTQKITAEVKSGDMPSGTQDITLTATVANGTGKVTLVSGGSTSGVKDVITGIAAGTISKSVTYGASCTASGTVASTYTFVVTFTSTAG
jgi:hypothetical protein